jgi:uncharacterized RDD family membrane protein YckC
MYQPAFLMPVTPQARMASLVQSVRTARAGAAVLDALAVLGIWALLFFFVYPPIFGDPFRFNPFNNLQFRLPITLFTVLSYYALQDAFGGTLAKRAMSLRVVNINFRPIGVGRGYARSCELLITIMMGFLGVIGAVVWIIVQSGMISRDGQSTGDKAGACWVVRTSDIPAG